MLSQPSQPVTPAPTPKPHPTHPLPPPGSPQTVFQTLGGQPIGCVQLIGDRVFAAAGPEVRGYSKKGKNFFTITTLMTETIHGMVLRDGHLQVQQRGTWGGMAGMLF